MAVLEKGKWKRRKRKTESESGNEKAEIGKWSSILVELMSSFAHPRSVSSNSTSPPMGNRKNPVWHPD